MKPQIDVKANTDRLNDALAKATNDLLKIDNAMLEPRDDDWFLPYAKTLLGALALIALILGVQGLLDRLERDTEARIEFLRIVDEKCIPLRKNESAIATHDGARVRCQVYARTGLGMVPKLVSAAVMDMPQ